MAPILSKPPPPPPRTPKEVADLAARKARPLLDGLLKVVESVLVQGGQSVAEVKQFVVSLGAVADRLVHGTVRMLEGYCCLDLKKYTRGPDTKLQGSLPILFVVIVLMMLYNAFVFAYMPAAGIAINSATSLLFHAFIFLVLASFVQAIHTDPGSIPKTAEWRTKEQPPVELRERKQTGSGEYRWCRKSEAYKPDRAHFCRILNRAVLRMDHHCPWLGNTIGFANHKFFFLFLLYANCACGLLGFGVLELLVHATLPALTTFLLIGAEGLTLLLSVILGPFLLFHSWLLARNMTTVEFCAMMRATKGEDPASEDLQGSVYDVGLFGNISSVLGENPLTWLLPIGGPPGNGLTFSLRRPLSRWSCSSPAAMAFAEKTAPMAGKLGLGAAAKGEEECEPEAEHPVLAQEDNGVEGSHADSQTDGDNAAVADDGCSGFLVWTDAAEFTDDLRVGCESIEESLQDAALSLASIVSLCGIRNRWEKHSSSRNKSLSRRAWRLVGAGRSGSDSSLSTSATEDAGSSGRGSGADFFSD